MMIRVGYAEALDLGRDVESYRRLIDRLADLNNQQRHAPVNLPDIVTSGQVIDLLGEPNITAYVYCICLS